MPQIIVTYTQIDPKTETYKAEEFEADQVKGAERSQFLEITNKTVLVAEVNSNHVMSIRYKR